ncbi:MAG TPA: Na-translocating system protein MpsC family protein [Solirubrobacteraceae bacterium]|nr:Na-translocating system protein MpsC family protein [Solirubrobacteraceae bacterium]
MSGVCVSREGWVRAGSGPRVGSSEPARAPACHTQPANLPGIRRTCPSGRSADGRPGTARGRRAECRERVLVTLMHDLLTQAEKSLAETGQIDAVNRIRHVFQETMAADFREAVERLTGR